MPNANTIDKINGTLAIPISAHSLASVKTQNENNWYAIYTRSRFEKKIHAILLRIGIESFLPLVKVKRKWKDRIKTIEVPLLPSYVFIKIPKNSFSQIYYIPGFVRFVTFCGKPCKINEEEILLLKKIQTHGFAVQPTGKYEVGDWVRITRGPLQGWEGRVKHQKNKSWLVIIISGIQQAISIEVARYMLESIDQKKKENSTI